VTAGRPRRCFQEVNQLFLLFLREAKLTPLLSHHTLTFSIHPLAMNTILRSLCPLRCNPASLFHTQANSAVQTKKMKNAKKRNTRGSCPTNVDRPLNWYHPLYFPYFLHYIRGHSGKRSLHRLLIPRSEIVSSCNNPMVRWLCNRQR